MVRRRSPTQLLLQVCEEQSGLLALLNADRTLVYLNAAGSHCLGISWPQDTPITLPFHAGQQLSPTLAPFAPLSPPPAAYETLGEILTTSFHVQHVPWRLHFIPLQVQNERQVLVWGTPQTMIETECFVRDCHAELLRLQHTCVTQVVTPYLLGDSLLMRKVREQWEIACSSQARTLIAASPGAGGLELARQLFHSREKNSSLLFPVDCVTHDAESLQALIRSAVRGRSLSDALPTLLLQRVDKLSHIAQQELLGFLRLPDFSVRIIATTETSLHKLVKRQSFSPELATLLTTQVIQLPQLRHRPSDLPLLAQWCVEQYNVHCAKQLTGLTSDALDRLYIYHWPNNVQEFIALLNDACNKASSAWVTAHDLPERLQVAWQHAKHMRPPEEKIDLDTLLTSLEKEIIQRAMRQARNNKSKAASLLGISRPRLMRRLEQLEIMVSKATLEEAIDFQPLEDTESSDS